MINKIKEKLHLEPLPMEGGFYCETYRSNINLPAEVLPDIYEGSRSISTAIFYLLTPDTHSAIHKLPGDEIYHFYLGDPVELLKLPADDPAETVILGKQVFDGMKLQEIVRAGTYQGARLNREVLLPCWELPWHRGLNLMIL